MECARCGCENPAGMKFCGECAAPLTGHCPQCGAENPPRFKFCGACATPLTLQTTVPRPESTGVNPTDARRQIPDARPAPAERRQLTVMFCDLVGSTALSTHLDLEELRELVQAYQAACAQVIERYDGSIAQYLGDGLLVYFGSPVAHEDDAARAVRTGLEIVGAMPALPLSNAPLPHPLQVRIGIHTGPVVVGEMGRGKTERLALGETPNVAARIQGLAEPDTVVISAATYRLVQGLFDCQDLGRHEFKGVATPAGLYRVVRESTVQSRFEVAVRQGLTPLVGREHEVGLLLERWERAKGGDGQVVLVSGEPGIGKSRLVERLKEQSEREGATRMAFRCSPYHQNSAFYPVIEYVQRVLQFARDDSPYATLEKLEHTLGAYRFCQADTLPLLAALLSLPPPERVPPLTLSPQRQKQKTQEALVAWLVEEAERQPVYCVWEDLHWVDPSSLELLTVLMHQVPTTRLYLLLTFRPEFTPPWGTRSHISQLTLSRLGRTQVAAMIEQVTGGKSLPAAVLRQIIAKTDGVPLFVEELTKTVVEAGVVQERRGRYELSGPLPSLAIPSTLQDSLMARLDRLGMAKEIAQLGATIGREFSYEVLQAVSLVEEARLQKGLAQLVAAELLYQRGLPPQAQYSFKHALIQEAAYQSLLKSTRQHLHWRIAQVVEARFPDVKELQPELLAHHYTEAGLISQAIPYWQRAGERATTRSAYAEAIHHLSQGLELLKTLPDTPERAQHELMLQVTLGPVLRASKGETAPEVEKAYARALELCRQAGETPQLFSVLWGLRVFYTVRGEFQTARELGEQLLTLAQRRQDPALFVLAHAALGAAFLCLGELAYARKHFEQGITHSDRQCHRSLASRYGIDPGVMCFSEVAFSLWLLGYPDQALQKSHEALTLTQEVSHPFSRAFALYWAAQLHQCRQEGPAVQEWTEALTALSREQGFPRYLVLGTLMRGWMLTGQGQREEGIAQMREGLDAERATGGKLNRPYFLALLAEAYRGVGSGR